MLYKLTLMATGFGLSIIKDRDTLAPVLGTLTRLTEQVRIGGDREV